MFDVAPKPGSFIGQFFFWEHKCDLRKKGLATRQTCHQPLAKHFTVKTQGDSETVVIGHCNASNRNQLCCFVDSMECTIT